MAAAGAGLEHMRPDSRRVGIAALVVSLLAGLTSNVVFLAAFQFRIEWFLEPTVLVGAGEASGELLRWASVLDLIGYYLATALLAYVLWRELRPVNAMVADLSAAAAFAYALAGGAGAAALAMGGPMLMQAYADASPAGQAVIGAQFALLFEVIWRSIWQLLDGILLAAWWLGIAFLTRRGQPGLSRLSVVLAAAATIGVLLNVLGLGLARDVVLGVVFALWTAWWIWLLVMLVRSRPADESTAPVGS